MLLKPGQLATINHTVYRAKRRTYLCDGCAFNNLSCPNIAFQNEKREKRIECDIEGIILIKVS